jgi:hypothetical protein
MTTIDNTERKKEERESVNRQSELFFTLKRSYDRCNVRGGQEVRWDYTCKDKLDEIHRCPAELDKRQTEHAVQQEGLDVIECKRLQKVTWPS